MASPNKEDETASSVKINLADFISCQCESSGSGKTVVTGPKDSCGPNIDTISITITLQSRAPGAAAGAGAAAGVSRPAIQDVPSDKALAKQDETTAGLDEETKDVFEDADLEQDKSDADTLGGKSVRIDSKEEIFEDAEPQEGLYEEAKAGDEELQGDEITDSDVADGVPDEEDSTKESGAAEDELLELGEDVGEEPVPEDESVLEDEPVPGEESSEPGAEIALEDESLEPGAEQDESIEQEIESEKQEVDSEEPEDGDRDKDVEEDGISAKASTGSKDDRDDKDGLSEKLTTEEGDEDGQEEDGALSPQTSLTDKDEPSHKSMQVLGSQIDYELADHSVTDLVEGRISPVDGEEVETTAKTEKDSDVSIQTYQTPIGSKADVMGKSRTSSKELPKAKSSSEVESRRGSKIIAGAVPSKSGSQVATFQLASDESGELCENCECASSSELTTTGTESDASKKPRTDSSDASKKRLPLTDSEASKRPPSDSVAFRQPLTDSQGPSQKSKPDGDSRTRPRGTVSVTDQEDELDEEGVCRPGLADGILLKNVGGFIVLCIIIRTIRVVGGFFR